MQSHRKPISSASSSLPLLFGVAFISLILDFQQLAPHAVDASLVQVASPAFIVSTSSTTASFFAEHRINSRPTHPRFQRREPYWGHQSQMSPIANRLFLKSLRNTSNIRLLLSFQPHQQFGMASARKRPATSTLIPSRHSIISRRFVANANEVMTHDHDNQLHQYRPLVIVLAGPTAVGKSDVAAELCSHAMATDVLSQHLKQQQIDHTTIPAAINTRGHVISADSVQVYRGVNIGANKPTMEEMERTPHHLVNVVDPPKNDAIATESDKASSYNAADWMRDTRYVVGKLTMTGGDADDESENGDKAETAQETLARRKVINAALDQSMQDSDDKHQTENTRQPILPVVVGGTMMYLQWLVHGRPDAIRPTEEAVKRADDAIVGFRQCASVQPESDGANDNDDVMDAEAWKAASTYVSSLGPIFNQRVEKLSGRDWYRLRRLLEVAYTIASTKIQSASNSVVTEEQILRSLTEKEVYTGIRSGSLPDMGYDVRCFFLCPTDRMGHFHTVDQRCEEMLLRGLLRETAELYVNNSLPDESQVARAIGYRQSLAYLKRDDAKMDDHNTFADFVDDFATATRQYAKKQMQWFRKDGDFFFVPVNMEDDKATRVKDTASLITDMCKVPRNDFEAELYCIADKGRAHGATLSLSAQTKLDNEKQGKGMKFFVSKRVKLVDGSSDLAKVLAEADECTRKVHSLETGKAK